VAFEEKRAWIMAVAAICTYGAYVVIILSRLGGGPLVAVSYVATLLWTIGISVVTTIVLSIAVAVTSPKDDTRKDQRDREISQFSGHVGHSFVVIGALTAMLLALARADHFWIANAVYLAFTLSAILESVTRIFAYRRGFQAS
jgi:cytochrome b561